MNKLMAFYDGLDARDQIEYTTFKTSIDIKNPDTGEYIFKGLHNKVIIPGSGLIARKLFDVSETEITPSYNSTIGDKMYTPATDTPPSDGDMAVPTAATKDNHKILLFCIGTDGCGDQNSQVYPVDYKKWIDLDHLVPFRYQLSTSDLSDELRDTYFGRTEVDVSPETKFIAYYFKRFEVEPRFVQQYVDATPVGSDVYTNSRTDAAESYIELNLKITKQDARDFFLQHTGIDEARINSISLCSAYPVKDADGFVYFKEIRPVTKLNIPNESLIDVSKGIDIIYHIYM